MRNISMQPENYSNVYKSKDRSQEKVKRIMYSNSPLIIKP